MQGKAKVPAVLRNVLKPRAADCQQTLRCSVECAKQSLCYNDIVVAQLYFVCLDTKGRSHWCINFICHESQASTRNYNEQRGIVDNDPPRSHLRSTL